MSKVIIHVLPTGSITLLEHEPLLGCVSVLHVKLTKRPLGINQNNWEERASQVKMMGEIHASAAKVTVFLNTASAVNYDESDLATYHLQKINESLKQPQWDISRQWARFDKITTGDRVSPG